MRKRWGVISILRSLHCSWVDFMTNTSSPGMKYICENGRKRTEKIFWTVVIISGVISTFFMIKGIYDRYVKNPFMTNIETTHYPSSFFPFPGITICNSNRILKSKAEAVIKQLVLPENVTSDEILEDFKLLWQLTDPEFPPNDRFVRLQRILDENRYPISDLMSKLTQSCEEMFEKCSWESRIVNCTDLFEIRKSSHGFCCSFNYFGMKDTRTRNHMKLPWRVEGKSIYTNYFGETMGLSVMINPMIHEYFVTENNAEGVSVIAHHPQDYPERSTSRFVGKGREVLMPITLNKVYCTQDVKATEISKRKCVFPDESFLYFFSEYRNTNCMAECMMNYTIKHCGCVPYYYPENGMITVCNLSHISCLHDHYDILNRRRPIRYGHDEMGNLDIHTKGSDKNYANCTCRGQCEQIFYRIEITHGDFLGSDYSVDEFFHSETNVTDRILIHIYLQTDFGVLTRRDTIHTLSDLISRLGGVVCLFLGCSVITVVEILYFCTLRVYSSVEIEKKKIIKDIISPVKDLSPKAIRDLKYPPVRAQRLRTIYVQAQDVT